VLQSEVKVVSTAALAGVDVRVVCIPQCLLSFLLKLCLSYMLDLTAGSIR
jgi:hypothetical protein